MGDKEKKWEITIRIQIGKQNVKGNKKEKQKRKKQEVGKRINRKRKKMKVVSGN